jgi:hypothetical protein
MTIILSFIYFAFLIKVFIPLTGNTILKGDLENFAGHGDSLEGITASFITDPGLIFTTFFGSAAKLRTYFNIFSRLLFLPFFSPSVLLVLAPLAPLFAHFTGGDENFIDLRFHYAAAVIPFLFIALIFGFSNLSNRFGGKRKEILSWSFCLALLLVNGGSYLTQCFTVNHLESIQWAQRVPASANLVTHGHLLPYGGYRAYNYYFGLPWENPEHPYFRPYHEADYYLFDFHVNSYPVDQEYLNQKLGELMRNADYELIRKGEKRFLFKRKAYVE